MTPNPIPQHIRIEMARRELAAMEADKELTDASIEKLDRAYSLFNGVGSSEAVAVDFATIVFTARGLALVVEVQLMQLRAKLPNLEARIAELRGAIKSVETGIVIPGMGTH